MKSACVAALAALAFCSAKLEAQEVSSVALRRVSNNVASRPDSARTDTTRYLRSGGPRLTMGSGAAYGAVTVGLVAAGVTYMTVQMGCDVTVSVSGASSCNPQRDRLAMSAIAAVVGSAFGALSGAVIGALWENSHKPQSANKD